MTLLDRICIQHRSMEAMARELAEEVAHGELERMPPKIIRLATALANHVDLENREFYPELLRLAEKVGEPQSAVVARLFAQNMTVIADRLRAFADKHQRGVDPVAFIQEWHVLEGVLARRIQDEESSLHPLYSRLLSRAVQASIPEDSRTGA